MAVADGAVLRTAGRLPAEVTSFVGRRRECAEVKRLLESARLVTLLGMGGVGKTRLALRTAADVRGSFPHGVCFVDLAAVQHAELLAQAVADALDLHDQTTRDPLDALTDHLAGRSVLLVLDTCEHLVDACAMLVEVLLRAGPGVRVLATSRQPLTIPGEHTMVVSPLDRPEHGEDEAVALFAERAAAVLPGFAVTEANRTDVVRLCHQLEGIPLAIELAAVRLRALPMDQIVARLGDRFALTGERRTTQARHQTLRAAIRWSDELCTPAERLAWARLSVFADGFGLPEAEVVCADESVPADAVLELVAGLVDKSVLTREPDGRYRMLDTLREYGAERLADYGETEQVQGRYLAHYLSFAERAERELATSAQARWFAWEAREHGNLRDLLDRAIRAGDAKSARQLFAGFSPIWMGRGQLREIRMWADRVLALRRDPGEETPRVVRMTLFCALVQGDLPAARPLLERLRQYSSTAADQAYLTQMSGIRSLLEDDFDKGHRLLDEALAQHRDAANADVLALITGLYATAARISVGDVTGALEAAESTLAVCRSAGEEWCMCHALWARAGCRLMTGETAEAQADVSAVLRIAARLDARITVTSGLELAAACAYELGDYERAGRLYGAADGLRRAQGLTSIGGHLDALWELAGAQLRERLGDNGFETATADGDRLSFTERVALGLGGRTPEPDNGVLTRRELEIAGLVAEGLSNREIAARLTIAKRTVDSHLEHILAKLGFASRTQVAVWISRPAGGSTPHS